MVPIKQARDCGAHFSILCSNLLSYLDSLKRLLTIIGKFCVAFLKRGNLNKFKP